MAWQQERAFLLRKMGTKAGYCLQNVRLAYDIPPKYASAKDAMLANKKAGTLHPMSTLPKNCAVPVFVDTSSQYEHVEVADHGTYYSDGKKVSNPSKQKFFGWGETLNGVRIVKYVKDPAPAPTPKPSGIKVGDSVIVNGQGTASSDGKGAKTRYYTNQKMRVIRIHNGRYGCNQYNQDGAITGWWTAAQVRKA